MVGHSENLVSISQLLQNFIQTLLFEAHVPTAPHVRTLMTSCSSKVRSPFLEGWATPASISRACHFQSHQERSLFVQPQMSSVIFWDSASTRAHREIHRAIPGQYSSSMLGKSLQCQESQGQNVEQSGRNGTKSSTKTHMFLNFQLRASEVGWKFHSQWRASRHYPERFDGAIQPIGGNGTRVSCLEL